MTPAEAQLVLASASRIDGRKPDPDAAIAWADALSDLRLQDCLEAVTNHYRVSSEWLMPVMIRDAVKRIRAQRIAAHPPLLPPDDLTVREEMEWLRIARRRIGDGEILADHVDTSEPDSRVALDWLPKMRSMD